MTFVYWYSKRTLFSLLLLLLFTVEEIEVGKGRGLGEEEGISH